MNYLKCSIINAFVRWRILLLDYYGSPVIYQFRKIRLKTYNTDCTLNDMSPYMRHLLGISFQGPLGPQTLHSYLSSSFSSSTLGPLYSLLHSGLKPQSHLLMSVLVLLSVPHTPVLSLHTCELPCISCILSLTLIIVQVHGLLNSSPCNNSSLFSNASFPIQLCEQTAKSIILIMTLLCSKICNLPITLPLACN